MIIQEKIQIKTEFYKNGNVCRREYLVDDKISRDPKDGPAIETFNYDGSIYYYVFEVNGKYHRDPKDGPAYECFSRDGSVQKEYCVDGIKLTQDEVDAILNPKPDCEGRVVEIDGIKYTLSKA